jgi:hypothetical protein
MGANAQTSVPLFTAGEVLTAANQNISAGTGVPVFATTTTRDAAFGGTGEKVLAEGQTCYVEAIKALQIYDGTVWRPIDLGQWQPWTPIITAVTGTFTTVASSGYYTTIGKTFICEIKINITTNGTAGTAIKFSLPAVDKNQLAADYAAGVARESAVTGNMQQIFIQGGGGVMVNYDNSYPGGNGRIIGGTFVYEVA